MLLLFFLDFAKCFQGFSRCYSTVSRVWLSLETLEALGVLTRAPSGYT